MSVGLGRIEHWPLYAIGTEPMTFEQILARTYPPGSFEYDVAKEISGSQVGRVRSLRRALGRLCDLGIIQILDRRPNRYRLHPFFTRYEHNPHLIRLCCNLFRSEANEGFAPHRSLPEAVKIAFWGEHWATADLKPHPLDDR